MQPGSRMGTEQAVVEGKCTMSVVPRAVPEFPKVLVCPILPCGGGGADNVKCREEEKRAKRVIHMERKRDERDARDSLTERDEREERDSQMER